MTARNKILLKIRKEIYHIRQLSTIANLLKGHTTTDTNRLDSVLSIISSCSEFKPSQKISELRKIYEMVEDIGALNICEIGTYKGGSLFVLCQAAPTNATIISIDVSYPLSRKLAFRKFTKPGQRLITIKGNTQDLTIEAKVKHVLNGELLDFLFIDGEHSLFGVMNDYVRFQPLVREGGLIVLHDIHPNLSRGPDEKSNTYVGSVPDFWDLLSEEYATDFYVEDPQQSGFGLGIIRKTTNVQ